MAEHEQEEYDYEGLPESAKITTHMMAGAAAGIMEHCIMYPVDIVKTRMQALSPDPRANYQNIRQALQQIIKHEGLKQCVRGMNATISGAGPAHAMYFATYEKLKKTLSSVPGGHGNAATQAVAGAAATLLHDAVMNPAEVVKQRMQMYGSPYKSCLECLRTTFLAEGTKAFYRSYTTQLTMNIPFQSTHFMVYEFCQDTLNKQREYKPETHVISGALAGGFAAAVTTPLDVCKTLLNTQEKCATNEGEQAVRGISHAVRTIYEFRGIPGFFKGLSARVVYQMPGTAISWGVYEFFKHTIFKQRSADSDSGYTSPVQAVQVHALNES